MIVLGVSASVITVLTLVTFFGLHSMESTRGLAASRVF